MKKDIILKDITKQAIKDVCKYIIKIDVDDFEFLDIEFAKIETRKADVLVKTDEKIIHIEFQTQTDSKMLLRMLRYYSEIKFRYPDKEVFQYVIYIGKYNTSMNYKLKEHNIEYNYELIDMKKIDCRDFLDSDNPEAVVVSILCDFKGKDERKMIRSILERLLKITKNENEFRKYFSILEELSTSRNLSKIVEEEEMALQYLTWEDLPSYRRGEKMGREAGMEKGLVAGIEKGLITGMEKGLEKGMEESKKEIIFNMMKVGMNDDMILKIVNIDKNKLNQIKDKYANS